MKEPSLPLKRGQNQLKDAKRATKPELFFRQLKDPLIYILMAAAGISLVLGEAGDMAIILTVILLNGLTGMIQEGKALDALDALKELTSHTARIDVDGIPTDIPAKDLIPGDLVYLEAGCQVPADLLLTSVHDLKIEESALTGESLPVEKSMAGDQKAYMSTNVTGGKGMGRVTAIGMDTEIGKIAGLIHRTPDPMTPLQKRLGDLGKLLSVLSILLCLLLFFAALLQKRDFMEMLLTAISLAVAAVPEGLPAVVTLVLALSVSRMVQVNTIVRRLPSVETLGCVSVVCSDKTGTLTQNKMSVQLCYSDGRVLPPDELTMERDRSFLHGFLLCNDAILSSETRLGDPTELALLEMGSIHDLSRLSLETQFPRIQEFPFCSETKRMTTVHRDLTSPDGNPVLTYIKGSPDDLLADSTHMLIEGKIVSLTATRRLEIQKVLSHFTSNSLRVLGVAMEQKSKTKQEGLLFLGLAAMKDPIRPEAKGAISRFCRAGVATVMITGDRPDTALAIAKELGIAETKTICMTGEELSSLSQEELIRVAPKVSVYAHVSPEHKMRIVSALQASGKIVAMTGDGVNDAPSLKQADVGIAMGMAGTDVAKNAADLVLTDDNFATIAKAMALGRSIYENIKKSVLFLLSSNFGEMITMLTAILAGFASPLKASHILWINLITDTLPALALGMDGSDTEHLMKRPPRSKDESLFAHGGLSCTLLYGCIIAAVSMTAFLQLPVLTLLATNRPVTLSALQSLLSDSSLLTRSQTYAFTVLGISQLFHALGMRDVETSIFRMRQRANPLMLVSLVLGFLLQLLVTEVPYFIQLFGTCHLTLSEWGHLLFLSSMPLLAHEVLILLSTLFRHRTDS